MATRFFPNPPSPNRDGNERWRQLCALAAQEQDSERLLKLVEEINELLEEKERRLRKSAGNSSC